MTTDRYAAAMQAAGNDKPQRPTVTTSMIGMAAEKLCKQNGWTSEQAQDIAAAYQRYAGGYELAKELDDRFGWSITATDVEVLDCMDSEVNDLLKVACLAWVRDHDIQPPLPVGTMTTRGEITGVWQHDAACYLVREPNQKDDTRRLIIKFEDAKVAA